ncbi:MAG: S41 family peptidase [Dysgonamonadaceae bacterium]|jgi:carboxyl-terminal processing protease|nr:S41 family peptidase [Dysgonamonadaceae bacterium]
MNSKKTALWLPVLVILTLIIGIVIGNYFSNRPIGGKLFLSTGNKIDVVLNTIYREYVDSVDMHSLVEGAIPKIVSELDPHSVYISAADLQAVNEDLEGHFSGIGVQFNIQNDTIMVVSVLSGGPSEKLGLQPGDRIVTINDSLFVGPTITNEKVMKNLRGPKGTVVTVGIKRGDSKELYDYKITRGDVPLHSVDIAYQIRPGIGFIKINKFGRTTYNEFIVSISKLLNEGCDSFIIDLRGNSGGYLDAAINIVNEFLPRGRLIVYTEGRAFPRNDSFANGTGTCQNEPLIILTDELSASASEIVAGAIQDNDRGTIIGRRTFGKGLVQNQFPLSDNSALRLTVARYYTPSGRSIQKKYELGKGDEYDKDLETRYIHGEFDTADSIKQGNNPQYQTRLGRIVFGGGGIMPDIFVPRDTTGTSSYYTNLINRNILYEFALQYADQHRNLKDKYEDYKSLLAHLQTQPLLDEVINFAESKGIRRRPTLIEISKKQIENITKAYIIRNFFGNDGFYPVFFTTDPAVKKAIEVIQEGNAFPVKQ